LYFERYPAISGRFVDPQSLNIPDVRELIVLQYFHVPQGVYDCLVAASIIIAIAFNRTMPRDRDLGSL